MQAYTKDDIHLSPLDSTRQRPFEQQQQQQQSAQEQQEHLQTIHPYYSTLPLSLGSKFKDLDLNGVYENVDEALLSADTRNLVIDFGKDCAYVAKDVGFAPGEDLDALVGPVTGPGSRPRDLRTRWICILTPHLQYELIETISRRYGISPRHQTMLLSKPPGTPNIASSTYSTSRLRRAGERIKEGMEWAREGMGKARRTMERESRVNLQVPNGTTDPRSPETPTATVAGIPYEPHPPKGNTGFMELVAKVWHWHAVEWGGRFICIGYNSLYNILSSGQESSNNVITDDKGFPAADANCNSGKVPSTSNASFSFNLPGSNKDSSDDEDTQTGSGSRNNYPEGRRLWTWLILCDDGTVISLHEPHQFRTTPSALDYKGQIAVIRKNLQVILRSLSRAPLAIQRTESERAKGGIGTLEELPFRKEVSGMEIVDSGPSLLFYYLFDNWYSSWSLAIDRQHPYAKRLRRLREELMIDPKLKHVDDLLHLAGQLAVLRRMYETYGVIIDRILHRQENSLSMAKHGGKAVFIRNNDDNHPQPSKVTTAPATTTNADSVSTSPYSQGIVRTSSNQIGDPNILGVPLSSVTVTRFERMRDRIELYALAEIKDCLEEKDGLVSMTFNLIAFRQTDAVEKLSRVAILLAKATILFMPLTLITGYFSMQIRGMDGKYTETDFWGSAGVVIALTLLVLLVLGWYTDTAEIVWVWEKVKQNRFRWFGGRGRHGKGKKKRN